MPKLANQLDIERCPHCSVDRPRLQTRGTFNTDTYNSDNKRFWSTYICNRCGGVVLAASKEKNGEITEMYPEATPVDEAVPERARAYLKQAVETRHAPAGSIMLSASAVDAMLKAKDYREGSLYSRIKRAEENQLVTGEMAAWAHEVRLDANFQRHADEEEELPTLEDAKHTVEFALALAEFLFVLPARVKRGRESTKTDTIS